MTRQRLVISGGGYAGVTLAHLLRRRRLTDRLDVTLVSAHPYQVLLTELLDVLQRRVKPDHICLPYRELFGGIVVHVVEGVVEGVDFAAKEIFVAGVDRLRYDYLVIAMGSQPALPPIPGLHTFGFPLWSREDAERLTAHLEHVLRQARDEADPIPWTSVIVGGGGFTGVEIAGELVELCGVLARSLQLAGSPSVTIVHSGPRILPGFDPSLVTAAERRLQGSGVQILTQSRVVAVELDQVKLDGGRILRARTFVWTGGVRVNERLSTWRLTSGPGGRVMVTPYLESVDHPNVFVIGDASLIMEPDGRPVPTTAQLAVQQAVTLANVLEARLRGGIRPQPFRPRPVAVAASVGPHYAVARVGPVRLKGRPAQWLKRGALWRYLWNLQAWRRILDDAFRWRVT
jgi:NADH dehydrogenase